MRFIRLLYVLYKLKLLTPAGLFCFISALWRQGINIMAILDIAAKVYGERIALVDDREQLTFAELFKRAEKLSILLQQNYQLGVGHKVGILCRNHSHMIASMFAISRIGADLYLLNAEMSQTQLIKLFSHYDIDFLIYDENLFDVIEHFHFSKGKIPIEHTSTVSIRSIIEQHVSYERKRKRVRSGRIVLLTGGTTGLSKSAIHKPSIFNYLQPLFTFVMRLHATQTKSVFIATPIYHGYGVAILLLFTLLGKKMFIQRKFEVANACQLIYDHQIQTVTLVPLMLHKMIHHNVEKLRSLVCIASGGAELSPKLVVETQNCLGDVLFNLYGTSETGLISIATPKDLRVSPNTIGRLLEGLRAKIVDNTKSEVETGQVGQLYVKNQWSMKNTDASWIRTGDLCYRDENGYYFLRGRADDMIVSGGENVYPIEVEQVLIQHPMVEDVAAIGVEDELFGQRLLVFVQRTKGTNLTTDELMQWLRSRVARYQVPRELIFLEQLPFTPVGKLDKRQLRSEYIKERKKINENKLV